MDKFGQCEPIICNKDGTIIGGHQRFRLLQKQGAKEIDISVPDRDLDEKEVEELNIRLNKVGGDWDFDILANLWSVEDLIEWGFDPEELDISLDDIVGDSSDSEEDKCYKITIESTNIVEFGKIKLEVDNIMTSYPNAKIKFKD